MSSRSCGGCTQCCYTMGVAAIKKPARTWCPHCTIGKGCQIYESRPDPCRGFECLWLRGEIPERFRPDKTGVVFDIAQNGRDVIAYMSPKADPLSASPVMQYIRGVVLAGTDVILVRGPKAELWRLKVPPACSAS